LEFAPVDGVDFENSQKEIDREFGRLICWISFGVGAEYLCKGVCILNPSGLQYSHPKVLRIPDSNEDVNNWARLVSKPKGEAEAVYERVQALPTFGEIAQRLLTLDSLGGSGALVSASMRLLAGTIRNRDAHSYTANVRTFQFDLVERYFVPSFNQLLRTLPPKALGDKLREAEEDIKLANSGGAGTMPPPASVD
jgi:hypothetical protein